MDRRSRWMSRVQMPMSARIVSVLSLYIAQVICLSLSRNHLTDTKPMVASEHFRDQFIWRTSQSPTTPDSLMSREPEVGPRRNRISDLFTGSASAASDQDSHRKQLGGISNIDQLHNAINLDNSLELEPEIVTSNHQSTVYELPSTSTGAINQNSRHYVLINKHHNHNHQQQQQQQQQQKQAYNNVKYNQKQHYIKYSPNIFANNYNLNYIHSFLTNKPPLIAQSTPPPPSVSVQNSQPSGLAAGSYGLASNLPQATHQQHYMSASPALSVALTSLHQTIAYPQLASINDQLQNPAPESALSTATPSSTSDERLSSGSNGTSESSRAGPSWPNCGRQQIAYREPRVVGGNSTYEGEFPWAVSIQRHGNHHCGGVIVGRQWILTAAHCVRSQLVANLAVRTGGHTLTKSSNSVSDHLDKDYPIEQIVMHDDFSRYDNLTASQMKSSANTNNADIALLKLRREIQLNDLAWPVCFPPPDAGNFSGHDATVIGWGKLNEKSEEFSNELQKVKLTIIDNKVCQNWFRQAGREMPIDDRIICAGFKHGGKDACHGDSGGPLLSRINGQYSVVGVVSTGIGCARPLLPGLYSRVSSYLTWIERHVSI